MLKTSLLLSALLLALSPAQAQTPTTTPAAAAAPSSPAKKELIGRILKVQQPGIEAMARNMAELPAAEIMERASAVLPSRVAADELRQLLTIMESPTWNKFQQLGGEMQRKLQEKLILDTRSDIEPKIKALEASVGRRLGITDAPAPGNGRAPAAKATAPAKPASR